jgi:hypothetical protein
LGTKRGEKKVNRNFHGAVQEIYEENCEDFLKNQNMSLEKFESSLL